MPKIIQHPQFKQSLYVLQSKCGDFEIHWSKKGFTLFLRGVNVGTYTTIQKAKQAAC